MSLSENQIKELQPEAEGWSASELLRWVSSRFPGKTALASSFGAEDVVLVDMAARAGLQFEVFTLDTNFLFPETYALISEIENRYEVHVDRVHPALTPEQQAEKHGEALWSREPNLCCQIRKIEPLKQKLTQFAAWITGIRREQSPTRANAPKLGWDSSFNLAKVNPIADWGWAQVWDYIRENNVPYNPLHDRNYPSIGCTYCTRPVAAGEDMRAGRWAGFAKTECGLHGKG